MTKTTKYKLKFNPHIIHYNKSTALHISIKESLQLLGGRLYINDSTLSYYFGDHCRILDIKNYNEIHNTNWYSKYKLYYTLKLNYVFGDLTKTIILQENE